MKIYNCLHMDRIQEIRCEINSFDSNGTFITRTNATEARQYVSRAADGSIWSYKRLRDSGGSQIHQSQAASQILENQSSRLGTQRDWKLKCDLQMDPQTGSKWPPLQPTFIQSRGQCRFATGDGNNSLFSRPVGAIREQRLLSRSRPMRLKSTLSPMQEQPAGTTHSLNS